MKYDLRTEINKFWSWISLKPEWQGMDIQQIKEQYNDNLYDDYPYALDFIRAVDAEIDILNKGGIDVEESVFLLLEAIAIDYLWEDVIEKCLENLCPNQRKILLLRGLIFPKYYVRYQIVERIKDYEIDNKEDLLENIVQQDTNSIVSRYALNTLAEIDIVRAGNLAKNYIFNEDEYLRLISIRILKEQNVDFLIQNKESIRNDLSKLVQNEIKDL